HANASIHHDLDGHATCVGEMRTVHIGRVLEKIPGAGNFHYDSRLPTDMQLVVNVPGQVVEYTCPGVPGLEEPHPIGPCREFLIRGNATKIEVIRAAYDEDDFHPVSGFYRSLGIIPLASVLEEGSRVNTLRMTCRSGLGDGMPVTIDFKE